ncbi:MAG TPA: NUDIX hydrolase [Dermatophilaceae bacterium]|nr:NUDIX hydrolase [Dermatophilaceae bacterium]
MSTVIRDFPIPQQLAATAHAWLSSPDRRLAEPKPAATVMLVRDPSLPVTWGGPEVFMLRRVSTMEFAPNVMVFPGGGVDERDADSALPWCGPSPQQWADQLATGHEAQARELVVAAAREVFEECGVLLAGPDEDTVVADVSGPQWHTERAALLSREQSFAQLLIRRGLVLRTDLMRARAHWLTPEFEKRRYDTRFFVALLPDGQTPDDQTSEADLALWVSPWQLLDEAGQRRSLMLPPTLVCIEQLAAAQSAEAAMRHGPALLRVMPVLVETDAGWVLRTELSA